MLHRLLSPTLFSSFTVNPFSIRFVGNEGVLLNSRIISSCQRCIYFKSPWRRTQDIFLNQYDPLEILGLDERAKQEDIIKAHARLSALYGSKGNQSNIFKLERVDIAFKILRDKESVYYARVLPSAGHRFKLKMELLQDKHHNIFKIRHIWATAFCILLAIIFLRVSLLPFFKIKRAVTR